ncbi:MAG: succinate--CoA ligase [ADP-forming] subunit alpha [Dehalococcoidia bacterium]|nr:MAG: succinate--CoA ligase [ADP-forming] subunit alpha [Dehalococcoidia bacterium]
MAILLDRSCRLLVQGITGREGSFHARLSREFGTAVVAGVTPGRGGSAVDGVPVFNTVEAAVRETGANTSLVSVPAAGVADAILEAASAGIRLIVCIADGVPVLDMVKVKPSLAQHGARLIGPNCPGITSPGERARVGIMPTYMFRPGGVGIVSRSGTLTYEAVALLSASGLGQSTAVGIGGDPVPGTGFIDVLQLFQEDPETQAIVLVGEIGGTAEEEAAAYIKQHVTKPVVAFIAGRSAPPGRRMGHAGAIISGGSGSAEKKIRALEEAGCTVVETHVAIGETMARVWRDRGLGA